MLLEISGEITPKRMKGWSQQKQYPVVDVTGDSNVCGYLLTVVWEKGDSSSWWVE